MLADPPTCSQTIAIRSAPEAVAAWLAGIITNLLILGKFYDVALRDFGLLIGALALARLATIARPSVVE